MQRRGGKTLPEDRIYKNVASGSPVSSRRMTRLEHLPKRPKVGWNQQGGGVCWWYTQQHNSIRESWTHSLAEQGLTQIDCCAASPHPQSTAWLQKMRETIETSWALHGKQQCCPEFLAQCRAMQTKKHRMRQERLWQDRASAQHRPKWGNGYELKNYSQQKIEGTTHRQGRGWAGRPVARLPDRRDTPWPAVAPDS